MEESNSCCWPLWALTSTPPPALLLPHKCRDLWGGCQEPGPTFGPRRGQLLGLGSAHILSFWAMLSEPTWKMPRC